MIYYTLVEITNLFKLPPQTIMRAIKRGDMEALKIGSGWRISSDQLQAFIDKRTVSKSKRRKITAI